MGFPRRTEKTQVNLVRLADAPEEIRNWHFWSLRQDFYGHSSLFDTVELYITARTYIYIYIYIYN
jgi:hypothetical protein